MTRVRRFDPPSPWWSGVLGPCVLAFVGASCSPAPPAAPPEGEAAQAPVSDTSPLVASPPDDARPGTWTALARAGTGGQALSAARMAGIFVLDRDCMLDHVAIGVNRMGTPCWTVGVELLEVGAARHDGTRIAATRFRAADAKAWTNLDLGTVPLAAGATYVLQLTDMELPQLPGSRVSWRIASTPHADVTAWYSALPPNEDWVPFSGDYALVVACRDADADADADPVGAPGDACTGNHGCDPADGTARDACAAGTCLPDIEGDGIADAADTGSGTGTWVALTAGDLADRGPLSLGGTFLAETFVLDRDCILDHVSIGVYTRGSPDWTVSAAILEVGDGSYGDLELARARFEAADATDWMDLDLRDVRLAAGTPYALRLQGMTPGAWDRAEGVEWAFVATDHADATGWYREPSETSPWIEAARDFALVVTCRDDGGDRDGDACGGTGDACDGASDGG